MKNENPKRLLQFIFAVTIAIFIVYVAISLVMLNAALNAIQ